MIRKSMMQKQVTLLIDTTGQGCHVGLAATEQMAEQYDHLSDMTPQSHAKQLLRLIDQLLTQHQLTPKDLTGIVYTQGPGAFTGIRIGISVVQGLALALNIPTLGVSSLHALAWQAAQSTLDTQPRVLVAIDARMKQVYWGVYQFYPDQCWQNLQTDSVGLPEQLPDYDMAIGDGIPLILPDNLASIERDIHLDQLWQMVSLGLEKGWLTWSTDLALPVYLRPESALISNNRS